VLWRQPWGQFGARHAAAGDDVGTGSRTYPSCVACRSMGLCLRGVVVHLFEGCVRSTHGHLDARRTSAEAAGMESGSAVRAPVLCAWGGGLEHGRPE
jgi:hypothetical protein